jgi:hypothetical protein
MSVKKMLLAATVILFSCRSKNNIPDGVIKPAKMQVVLFDVIRADNFVFQYVTKDSSKKPEAELAKLQQQIFAVHKISRADYYKSYEFYKAHPDIMQPMLDSLINITTRNKYKNTMGHTTPLKDSLKVE